MSHTTKHQQKERKRARMEHNMTLDEYRTLRIEMLEFDFMIPLTDEEKEHLNSLTTEIAIDAAIRAICKKRWEKD